MAWSTVASRHRERESRLRRRAWLDAYVNRSLAEGLVPRTQRVLAGWHLRQLEASLRVGDRVVGMPHHDQRRLHPAVLHVAHHVDASRLLERDVQPLILQ